MSREEFLSKVMAVEDKLKAIHGQAARRIKDLPLIPASRAEAKAVQKYVDQESEEMIYNIIKQGAEAGEEEAIRQTLIEMKRRWGI